MDVFHALEERVEKVIEAYGQARTRVAELEKENRSLKEGSQGSEELQARVAELEAERDQVRARLEKVLVSLSALEL